MKNSENEGCKNHWENVYETKNSNEVSWTQEIPETSLELIQNAAADKTSKIIDIGGGDGTLIDFLLERGFESLSILDISSKALQKAKKRLGSKAEHVQFITSDIREFETEATYEIWHDRATFHFLTEENDIKKYVDIVKNAVSHTMIIGAFSFEGPQKCSGLPIVQYDAERLQNVFLEDFELIRSFKQNHITPFNTVQNFIFCQFKKKKIIK
jgi:cyclopropane fatty-acyl-phospholipid synthase-like methyltransferase